MADAAAKPGSDLTVRVVSALALAPVVIAAVWFGGPAYALLALAAAAIVVWEWMRIVGMRPRQLMQAAVWAGLVIAAWYALAGDLTAAGICAFMAAGVAAGFGWPRWAWAAGGALYAALPMIAFIALREGEAGLIATAWLVAIVWATDIFAYFSGRAIGGPKIWPAVSPKKTWAGLIGGTLAAAVAGALVARAGGLAMLPLAVLGAVLAVASQAGDFAESAVKRRFGVKDASNIIPGHGGVMDRIDGLGAAAVIALCIGLLRSGGQAPAAGLMIW
ncbi:MAG: phosphatidate cytidylyltransferase [Flavobacteriaceae bacterium]